MNSDNKIRDELQAVCLKSELYERIRELCSGITDEQLAGVGAIALWAGQIYKEDVLYAVREA